MSITINFRQNDFNTTALRTISKYGHEDIQQITIFRRPLSKFLTFIMNALTWNSFNNEIKNQAYDSLMHLGLIIRVNNTDIRFDKTQSVNLFPENIQKDKTEFYNVPINKQLTLLELINHTINYMGRRRFFEYNGHTNNCQTFALAVLDSNGLGSQTITNYIHQNVDWLFHKNPTFKKLLKFSTDTAQFFENTFQGSGSGIKLHTGRTSSSELEQIASKLSFHLTFLPRDEPSKINKENYKFYIINLDSRYGNGTHWTALIVNNNTAFYVDSYGVFPPQQIERRLHELFKTVYYNSTQYQSLESDSCGLFALGAILFMILNDFNIKKFNNDFIKMFSNDLKENDNIIKKILEESLN